MSALEIQTAGPTVTRARAALLASSRNVLPMLGAAFLLLMAFLAVFGPALAPHDPGDQSLTGRLQPPAWVDGGSTEHLFGTDQLGRDILSRLMVAVRVTMVVGFGVALIVVVIGATLGILAGYFGGRTERVIMRLVDIQMGFPVALLYIFIILIFGQALHVVMLALALIGWMVLGGIVRVAVKRVRNATFVEAATVSGSKPLRTIVRHIVPQIRGEVMTLYFLEVGRVLLAEAALSYLGLGVQPPLLTWGLLIGGAQPLMTVAPWMALLPGILIVATVVSINLVASYVENHTDARQRRQT
jgi:peptide/nickel transport system permease protein